MRNLRENLPKTVKSKGSTTTYYILLAIFFSCVTGFFVLSGHSMAFIPSDANNMMKVEPVRHIPLPEVDRQNTSPLETKELALTQMIPEDTIHITKSETKKIISLSNKVNSKPIYNPNRFSVEEVRATTLSSLRSHPLHEFTDAQNNAEVSVEKLLVRMHQHEKCHNIPLIITMAKVGSPVYWQLVENFQYTMAKFNLSECSLLICLDDLPCLEMCKQASFPCYNYADKSMANVSAFEQIGKLKLFEIPKALASNIPLLMIDLDVGFRQNPLKLVGDFLESDMDILVQKDVAFVMNRTVAGWRTWYTQDTANLGLFLCKGNQRVVKMFKKAWRKYEQVINRKNQPGTDQNVVQGAMGRRRFNTQLSWGFFPDKHVVLIDKVFKFETTAIELGGELSSRILMNKTLGRDTIAVHATCYELKTKVSALKAAGAFFDPFYYEPARRTLTMKLLYVDKKQLTQQVLALVWLALATNRTLIVPNALADSRFPTFLNATAEGHVLWPGFRILHTKDFESPLTVVEPAYYWRISQEFTDSVPSPFVLSTSVSHSAHILPLLQQHANQPRVVLNVLPMAVVEDDEVRKLIEKDVRVWAESSVGVWKSIRFKDEMAQTQLIKVPNDTPPGSIAKVYDTHRLCSKIMVRPRGNRSCFDKCK